jgi:hypothetical protein
MKITFHGWGRQVYPHEVKVIPCKQNEGFDPVWCSPVKNGKSLRWSDGMTAFGKLNGLALSGAFLAEFQFTEAELKNWLRSYLSVEPERALELIRTVQAEAIRRMAKNSRQT